MSNSKPLPPFAFDLLYYLNRDQLERFSIVCRPLKNLIERYFRTKPYRVFYELRIRRWAYALRHNRVHWHPNRDDYSVQKFFAGEKAIIDEFKRPWHDSAYYPLDKMRPFLGPTVRIKKTTIGIGVNCHQIEQMESIAYLWRDGDLNFQRTNDYKPILNSPTILQCRNLYMGNPYLSVKDYKVLYTVKVIETCYGDPTCWLQFLEQPGIKPLIVLRGVLRELITNTLDHLCKGFSSAVLPNTYKIVFATDEEPLTEFRETNKTSGEILELKKGIPLEWKAKNFYERYCYILERSSI